METEPFTEDWFAEHSGGALFDCFGYDEAYFEASRQTHHLGVIAEPIYEPIVAETDSVIHVYPQHLKTVDRDQSNRESPSTISADSSSQTLTLDSNSPITSSSNNSNRDKKLRHREVEKNRHRQLQAMVRNLSERIPGKREKETQVQIMKRAARYCVYLREVIKFYTSNNPSSPSSLASASTSTSSNSLDVKSSNLSASSLSQIYMNVCELVDDRYVDVRK